MSGSYLRGENGTVHFPFFNAESRSIKHAIKKIATSSRISVNQTGRTSIQALRNINLSLEGGDRLGLIGPNGAGKTTLLKLLAGIYFPTHGTVERHGVVSTLFNLGLGLDYNATGIENIYLANYLRGVHKSEIRLFVDDIVEFTELGEFIHTPVRTYSAGMLTRLAFAIATAFAPDILLIDEIFGTGDRKFFIKSALRMEQLMHKANIFVFASHNDFLIRKFCNKALYLRDGMQVALGEVDEILEMHNAAMSENIKEDQADQDTDPDFHLNVRVAI